MGIEEPDVAVVVALHTTYAYLAPFKHSLTFDPDRRLSVINSRNAIQSLRKKN